MSSFLPNICQLLQNYSFTSYEAQSARSEEYADCIFTEEEDRHPENEIWHLIASNGDAQVLEFWGMRSTPLCLLYDSQLYLLTFHVWVK